MSSDLPPEPDPEDSGDSPESASETRATTGWRGDEETDLRSDATRPFIPRTPVLSGPTLIGETLGGCHLEELVGRGAIGFVYRARQLTMGGRVVAIKAIPDTVDAEQVERFQREAKAASLLKTDYVVEVYHAGYENGWHFLIQEYVGGGTLSDYLKSCGDEGIPTEEIYRFLRQAAEGLLEAEQHVNDSGVPAPIVHRDLKPANLLLKVVHEDGEEHRDIRIVDFGAAKIKGDDGTFTGLGAPMTPAYASPEQWEVNAVDSRTDMYCLGATFFHLTTGQKAVPSTETREIKLFTTHEPWLDPRTVRPEVPEHLADVIMKMTQNLKEDRYQSFGDLLAHLDKIQAGIDPKIKHRNRTIQSLKKRLLAFQIAIPVVLVAVIFALVFFSGDPNQAGQPIGGLISRYEKIVAGFDELPATKYMGTARSAIEDLQARARSEHGWAAGLVEAGSHDPGDRVELRDGDYGPDELVRGLGEPTRVFREGVALEKTLAAIAAGVESTPVSELSKGVRTLTEGRVLLRDQCPEPLSKAIDALVVRVSELKEGRPRELDLLAARFRAGPAQLQELVADVAKFRSRMEVAREQSLEQSAHALGVAIATAQALDAELAKRSKSAGSGRLARLGEALDWVEREMLPAGDTDLDAWKRVRLQRFGEVWRPHVNAAAASFASYHREALALKAHTEKMVGTEFWLQEFHTAQKSKRLFNELGAPLWLLREKLDGRAAAEVFRFGFSSLVRTLGRLPAPDDLPAPRLAPPIPKPAQPAPEQRVRTWPKSWTGKSDWQKTWSEVAAEWDAHERLIPTRKIDVAGKSLTLWRFEGRYGARPVEMALIVPQAGDAFLIDVHPVTIEEFDEFYLPPNRGHRVAGMVGFRSSQDGWIRAELKSAKAAGRGKEHLLLRNILAPSARRFAQKAYLGIGLKFDLPAPEQWAAVRSVPASAVGREFVASVPEWNLRDGTFERVGGTKPGFRLVYKLERW